MNKINSLLFSVGLPADRNMTRGYFECLDSSVLDIAHGKNDKYPTKF
jgi:hypothetical protein